MQQEVTNPELSDFKKAFLLLLIFSLIIGALISIFIFLFGQFHELEIRIILTTFSISIFSLLGMLFSRVNPDYARISDLIITSIMFVITILSIWNIVPDMDFYKYLLTYFVLLILIGQAPFILREFEKLIVKISSILTFVFACILALMIILYIFDFTHFSETYFRVMGAIGVLYFLGLVVTPLLNRLLNK